MQREPFDSSVVRRVGYDPATCTHEVESPTHRIYRIGVVPQEGMAVGDAELAGAHFSAHFCNAYECWRLVNRAGAKHHQASLL